MTHGPTRRTVLATGAAACVAGCGKSGGNGSSGSASAASPTASSTASAASPAATSTATSAAGSAAAGKELAKTADIPVGGGTIFAAEEVVVTQPEKGEFKAFSNICTHRQCPVANVSDGTINCTCHGSRFRITDGSVAHPPAPQPLPEKKITVEGDTIRLV
ncbi:Rieske (2Fe-2S) protein [Streptomyces sp. NPDC059378]|uniref:Rieske (2Fe-2S) protein n=1 Tax=Streptomyces sp. NPDC059378 TaxID=3346815 RepID=UPI00369212C6